MIRVLKPYIKKPLNISPHKSYKQQLAEKKRRQQEEIDEALRATADFAKLGQIETKKSEEFSHPGYKLTGNIPFLAPFRDQSENPNTHANMKRTNLRRKKEVEDLKYSNSNFSSSNTVLTNGSTLTFQDWVEEFGEEFDINLLYNNNIDNDDIVIDSNKGDPFKHKKIMKRSVSLNNTNMTQNDNNSGFSPISRYI